MILQMVVQGYMYSECMNCGAMEVPVVFFMLVRPAWQEPYYVIEAAEYCERCLEKSMLSDIDVMVKEVKGAIRRSEATRNKRSGRRIY